LLFRNSWTTGSHALFLLLTAFSGHFGTKTSLSLCLGIGLAKVLAVATRLTEVLTLLRACFTIVAVAVLSAGLAQLRDVQGQQQPAAADVTQIAWVRTVDGWEPSAVLHLESRPQGTPPVHPALVASLQLGVSLFALLALPTATRATRKS